MTSVLVTGATGHVGRFVVDHAARRGLDVAAAVREIGRRPLSGAAHQVPFDFHDASTWSAALDGIDRVFLLRPPAISDVDATLNPFIDAAFDCGVDHLVFLSVVGSVSTPTAGFPIGRWKSIFASPATDTPTSVPASSLRTSSPRIGPTSSRTTGSISQPVTAL